MKAHIVLAHPEPKSFNGTLAEVTRTTLDAAGHSCTMSDLYAMDFDPREGPQHFTRRAGTGAFHTQTEQRFNADANTLPDVVQREMDHLHAADLLVVHFPLWWFGMPAILKGWMDRVFVYGALYRSTARYDTGLLSGKWMIACVTTGASAESCAPNGREGDTRLVLWPVLYPFHYLGYSVLQPSVLHGIGGVAFVEGFEDGLSTMDLHKAAWSETLATLDERDRVAYNSAANFDDANQLRPGVPVYSPFIRHPD